MAEEVLRTASGEGGGESNQGFEGMEALAQAIELGQSKVYVCLWLCVIDGLLISALQCWLEFR